MYWFDVSQQGGIFTEALARQLWMSSIFAPMTLKVAAGADVQHFALQRDRPELLCLPIQAYFTLTAAQSTPSLN